MGRKHWGAQTNQENNTSNTTETQRPQTAENKTQRSKRTADLNHKEPKYSDPHQTNSNFQNIKAAHVLNIPTSTSLLVLITWLFWQKHYEIPDKTDPRLN